MSEVQNVAKLFYLFVRGVVRHLDSIADFSTQIERLSELYRRELADHPWELLSALRETENRLKIDLGDRYHISFAKNIADVAGGRHLLGYSTEQVEYLSETFSPNLAWLPSDEGALFAYFSENVLRPRHLVYYMYGQRDFGRRSSGAPLWHFANQASDALVISGAHFADQGLASWMKNRPFVSSEEQVDGQFLAYIEAKKNTEDQLGSELGKLAVVVQETASQVEELNDSISELTAYFDKTSDWVAKIERQLASHTAKGMQ